MHGQLLISTSVREPTTCALVTGQASFTLIFYSFSCSLNRGIFVLPGYTCFVCLLPCVQCIRGIQRSISCASLFVSGVIPAYKISNA